MKKKFALGLFVLVLCFVLMGAGCTQGTNETEEGHVHEEGEACVTDSDCHEGDVCHNKVCETEDEHESH